MLKRICIIALSVLLCLSLTGCGLVELFAVDKLYGTATEALESARLGQRTQEQENLLRNISANNRSQKTEAAYQKVLKKEEFWNTWSFGSTKLKAAMMTKHYENLNTAANSDPIYLESLKSGAGDQNSLWDKLKAGGLGVIAIVAVIIVVLLILLNFLTQRKTAKNAAKVAKQEVKAIVAPTKAIERQTRAVENKQATRLQISDNSYQRMLSEDCAALGLNPNEVLAQYGGNLELACSKTRLARINQNR